MYLLTVEVRQIFGQPTERLRGHQPHRLPLTGFVYASTTPCAHGLLPRRCSLAKATFRSQYPLSLQKYSISPPMSFGNCWVAATTSAAPFPWGAHSAIMCPPRHPSTLSGIEVPRHVYVFCFGTGEVNNNALQVDWLPTRWVLGVSIEARLLLSCTPSLKMTKGTCYLDALRLGLLE